MELHVYFRADTQCALRYKALLEFSQFGFHGKKTLRDSILYSDSQRNISQYCAW